MGRAGVQEVRLPGLTKRAAEKLVKTVLPDVRDDVIARIVERAEGNPFHLEELVRHVAEHGGDSVPDTVLALADARISRLDPEARRFLRVASVFGETFWEEGVTALLDCDTTGVVARLTDRELIVPGVGRKFSGEHVFRHGLLRDAAYAMLADDDRAQLHLRAAEWLARAGEKDALILAEHCERAGALERAVPHLLRAAEAATEAFHIANALVCVERAIRCGAKGTALGQCYLVQAVEAASRGDHATAAKIAKQAYQLVEHRSPFWYMAASTLLTSGTYVGDFELAPLIIQELLTSAPEGPPTPAYGTAVRMACDILDSVGQQEGTMMLLGRVDALAVATPNCNRMFLAEIEFARAGALNRRDHDLGVSIAAGNRGVEHVRAMGGAQQEFFDFGMGMMDVETGRFANGREALRRAGAAFLDKGMPLFHAWTEIHVGWSYWFEARYDEAIAAARTAVPLDPRHARCMLAAAHLGKGELPEATRQIDEALRGLDDEIVTPFVISSIRTTAARIALANGQLERAKEIADTILQTSMGVCPPATQSHLDRVRIEIHLARGEREHAREIVRKSIQRIERHARSLDEDRRRTYLAMPDHIRIFELRADPGA